MCIETNLQEIHWTIALQNSWTWLSFADRAFLAVTWVLPTGVAYSFHLQWSGGESCSKDMGFVPQNGIWYDACICEPSSTAQMTLPHVKWPRRILAQEKKAYMCCHGPRKGIRRIGFKQGTSWWSLWLHQREHSWDCQRGNGSSTRENIQWVCHQKCLN